MYHCCLFLRDLQVEETGTSGSARGLASARFRRISSAASFPFHFRLPPRLSSSIFIEL